MSGISTSGMPLVVPHEICPGTPQLSVRESKAFFFLSFANILSMDQCIENYGHTFKDK
jgi:hypothetical protein